MLKTVYKLPTKAFYRLEPIGGYNIATALNTERIIRIRFIDWQGTPTVQMNYKGESKFDVLLFSHDTFTDVVDFFNNELTQKQLKDEEDAFKSMLS